MILIPIYRSAPFGIRAFRAVLLVVGGFASFARCDLVAILFVGVYVQYCRAQTIAPSDPYLFISHDDDDDDDVLTFFFFIFLKSSPSSLHRLQKRLDG